MGGVPEGPRDGAQLQDVGPIRREPSRSMGGGASVMLEDRSKTRYEPDDHLGDLLLLAHRDDRPDEADEKQDGDRGEDDQGDQGSRASR